MTLGTYDILNLLGATLATFALGYAAFWGLKVRSALGVKAYKKQAVGIGLIALLLAGTNTVNTIAAYLVFGSAGSALEQGGYGLFFIFLLLLLYWTDSSVATTRRTDPLSRDTLRWSRVRIPLWIAAIPGSVVIIVVDVHALLLNGGHFSWWYGGGSLFQLGQLLLIPAIFVPLISGVVLFPIIRRRTPDRILRSHFSWFAAFAVVYFVFNNTLSNLLSIALETTPALFFDYASLVVCSYCLYRSALSLTPVNLDTSRPTQPQTVAPQE